MGAAELSMARLNRIGAKLMHKHGATSATDVTGFGILGHATNLAEYQAKKVKFTIHTLPIISNMTKIASCVGNMFQLLQGYSAETSGGLCSRSPAQMPRLFAKKSRSWKD